MKLRDKGKYNIDINDDAIALTEEPELRLNLIEKDKALNAMEIALHQLSNEQQQCVTLFYLQKKSYQEITDLTGYTLLQVKSYIQNGKRNLKILLLQQQLNEQ